MRGLLTAFQETIGTCGVDYCPSLDRLARQKGLAAKRALVT